VGGTLASRSSANDILHLAPYALHSGANAIFVIVDKADLRRD